jgi:hypothetical protein
MIEENNTESKNRLKTILISILNHLDINKKIYLMPVQIFIIYVIFLYFIPEGSFVKKEILNIIISTSAILGAILITYLFGKLFSDKTKYIEIKKIVDHYAVHINSFRNLIFRLTNIPQLWEIDNKKNIITVIKQDYPNLTLYQYREELGYEEFQIIEKNINYTQGQAYLAMKYILDDDESFMDYDDNNFRNYSLEDIASYSESLQFIWSYLDRSAESKFIASKIPDTWFERLDEYYFKIKNERLLKQTFKQQIKDLMDFMKETIFKKHYYYNSLLPNGLPHNYKSLFTNIFILSVVIIASIIMFMIEIEVEYQLTLLVVSTFIYNLIDTVISTFLTMKNELKIEERYTI